MQAFNVRSLQDSNVMREDSHVMKTLAIVAMVFLPISTVSSIFGTQFFGTTPSPDGSTISTHVSGQFWMLWVVIIPLSVLLLSGWMFWIRRFHWNARGMGKYRRDAEIGNRAGMINSNP